MTSDEITDSELKGLPRFQSCVSIISRWWGLCYEILSQYR